MLSRFFIDRPVFAWVIAIIMMLAGALAIYNMPISQYPDIAPPSIAIKAFYPGASAETVENTVTQIIEQKMTGFDNLLYLSGNSSSSGSSRLELTFTPGTDPDLAWSQVQNKLQLAMASLPDVVQRQGVKVSKSTRNYLIIVGLISEDGSMSGKDLRDYSQSNLEKVLSRIPGVGEVENFGTQYAMRIWIDPNKLTSYSLTFEDVIEALRAYNVEVSAGQLGDMPAESGQRLNASIIVQHLLETPEEFSSVPVKINQNGSVIKIGDIARVDIGTERYGITASYNGKQAAAMAIRKASGANAIATADAVTKKLEELSSFFPDGMKVIYPYDTTPFTKVAIEEVFKTLIEAVILVFIVMFLFLGNFRSTLIPTMAVPVVLLGTFAFLGFFGFSINMLTMFAMVLAIGLLVDDAIVVVENVERIMEEENLSPKEATKKSMDEITSALVGIGLVLAAVFSPMAFLSGSTGVIYRQFSITIVASMLLSVVVALILTPVLCVSLLKSKSVTSKNTSYKVLYPFQVFFKWFNSLFNKARDTYVKIITLILVRKLLFMFLFVLIVIALVFLFERMPTSYLPDEDQGIMMVQVTLPPGSALGQTEDVLNEVSSYFLNDEKDAVESVMTISGASFGGEGQNVGMGFVKLKDWALRERKDLKVDAVIGRSTSRFSQIRRAVVFAFSLPAVAELGNAKGFDFQLQDRGGLGHEALMDARNEILQLASQDPRLRAVRHNGLDDVPQYHVNVDWEKAGVLGVPLASINNTISAAFGSSYVNDFIESERVKRVYVQADSPYRMVPEDLKNLYVRGNNNDMVPFTSFATGHWAYGSPLLERYNAFPSINIWGEPAPGRSSGEAMKIMESFVSKLSGGFSSDWTGLSFQERMAGSQAPLLYAFSILVIFLCLAALYESWPIPISILLTLPLGIIGGIIASSLRGLPNDVYFQIGLLATMGLATKNSILIVQFAKARVESGIGLTQATLEAARLRLRPIIMTSLAFMFGVLPLAKATGAGAGAQIAIGTGVLGGMLTSTFLVTIYAPLFYVMIYKLLGKKRKEVTMKYTDSPLNNPIEDEEK